MVSTAARLPLCMNETRRIGQYGKSKQCVMMELNGEARLYGSAVIGRTDVYEMEPRKAPDGT